MLTIDDLRINVDALRRFGGNIQEKPYGRGVEFILTTVRSIYGIFARPANNGDSSYLGAMVACRESGGGNDLADGRLTAETWNDIIADIVAFEARPRLCDRVPPIGRRS